MLKSKQRTNKPNYDNGTKVATYLDSAKDAVSLEVGFRALDNHASYVAKILLDAKAKNLTVNVQNSGYHPVGR